MKSGGGEERNWGGGRGGESDERAEHRSSDAVRAPRAYARRTPVPCRCDTSEENGRRPEQRRRERGGERERHPPPVCSVERRGRGDMRHPSALRRSGMRQQLCRACAAGVRAEPDARKKPWTTQNHARPGGPARKRERAEPITGAASTNRAAIFGAAPDVATHSDASSGPDRPDEHPRQPKPDSRTEPAERRPAAAPNLTPEPEPAER